ncbi:hypothetical protein TNCV_532531 [Trichonephila clavipes]|nr:hypothetical protein TNCV_532531 [Trichonephila clavipes]
MTYETKQPFELKERTRDLGLWERHLQDNFRSSTVATFRLVTMHDCFNAHLHSFKWQRVFPTSVALMDGNMEHRARSQRPPITNSREDMHITCMALMNRAEMSQALSQELGSFARQQVSARTVR